MRIDTAYIPAGGKGTRLRPLTYETPKPLIEVNGKTIIEHTLLWMCSYGIKNVIMGLNYMPERIKDFLGDGSKFGINIEYIIEQEEMSDGGALKLAEDLLPERFLFESSDHLTDMDPNEFEKQHQETLKKGGIATVFLVKVPKEDTDQYGIATINEDNRVLSFIEKPKEYIGNLANTATYIMEKEILNYIPDSKYCHLGSEIMPKLVEEKKLYAYPSDCYWIDIGSKKKLQRARDEWK